MRKKNDIYIYIYIYMEHIYIYIYMVGGLGFISMGNKKISYVGDYVGVLFPYSLLRSSKSLMAESGFCCLRLCKEERKLGGIGGGFGTHAELSRHCSWTKSCTTPREGLYPRWHLGPLQRVNP